MEEKPEDIVKTVVDYKTFLKFVSSLGSDWEAEQELEKENPASPRGPGALGWDNGTIGAFLEAAAACGTSHLGQGGIVPGANPWRACAETLLSGKYYE